MTIELDALIQCRRCDIELTADRIVVPIARGSDLLAMEQVVRQELRSWHVDGRRGESFDGGSRRILTKLLMLVLVIERNVHSNGFLRKRDDCHCFCRIWMWRESVTGHIVQEFRDRFNTGNGESIPGSRARNVQ